MLTQERERESALLKVEVSAKHKFILHNHHGKEKESSKEEGEESFAPPQIVADGSVL